MDEQANLWYANRRHSVLYWVCAEEILMAVSYRKLWKLLIDKDMKKKDLRLTSGISTNALAKLGKNERVTTDVIDKICCALNCDVGDIMEIVDDGRAHTIQGGSDNEN